MDKEQVTLKKTIKDIWGSIFRKGAKLKYKLKDDIDWTIIGKNKKLKTFTNMYNGYHVRYKYKFLKPIFYVAVYIFAKLNKLVLGKTMIKADEVEKEKCNRTEIAWNNAITQTCKDVQLVMKKDIKAYHNPNDVYWVKFTKLLNDIFMQTIYYDTFFRGFWEMFVINLTMNINDAYDNDKKHILYHKQGLDDIDFYMATERNDNEHIIIEDNIGLIVIPKGYAIRVRKQDVNEIKKALEEKEKEKEKTTEKP